MVYGLPIVYYKFPKFRGSEVQVLSDEVWR